MSNNVEWESSFLLASGHFCSQQASIQTPAHSYSNFPQRHSSLRKYRKCAAAWESLKSTAILPRPVGEVKLQTIVMNRGIMAKQLLTLVPSFPSLKYLELPPDPLCEQIKELRGLFLRNPSPIWWYQSPLFVQDRKSLRRLQKRIGRTQDSLNNKWQEPSTSSRPPWGILLYFLILFLLRLS